MGFCNEIYVQRKKIWTNSAAVQPDRALRSSQVIVCYSGIFNFFNSNNLTPQRDPAERPLGSDALSLRKALC